MVNQSEELGLGRRELEFIALLTSAPPHARLPMLRALVELQPCACCVHCLGEVLCANSAFAGLTGCDDGRNLDEIVPRRHLPHVWQRVETHAPGAYDTVICTMTNGWRLVHIEPTEVAWGDQRARLVIVRPLARLPAVEWIAGGGVSVTA